eukprot:CAMPEP_0184870150 /NCGR_PEP_ID=MMETSP0580-20130426/36639_1 /TAXON_ID=1118495 /ORGANISM="Dactyliosolen fragilissimus" /LENGTH=285 /DNA_ID=CAMNT_0027372097 /DNA_START=168 /DNA_END=1022 /DNA_ORIENTATION=-
MFPNSPQNKNSYGTSDFLRVDSVSTAYVTRSQRTDSYTNTDGATRQPFADHLGKHRQYWRDIILGVNDGLISTFLLVSGVSGGGLKLTQIGITAVSGAVAGSISMFSGEFLATKSQEDVFNGEIEMEKTHIRIYHSDEVRELSHLLPLIGIPTDSGEMMYDHEIKGGNRTKESYQTKDAAMTSNNYRELSHLKSGLIEYYSKNEKALLKLMIALEFGVLDEERRNPYAAGLMSGSLFFLGSLPSVLPFLLFTKSPQCALRWAAMSTCLALFLVGAAKTIVTRRKW